MSLEGRRATTMSATTMVAFALLLPGCGGGANGRPGTAGTSGSTSTGSSSGSASTGTTSGSASTGSTSGSANAGSASGSASASGATNAGSCNPDPLHTGLTAQQTGVSVDAFDCQILEWTAKYSEPDPMIFKAIIYVESRFDDTSVACPNLPCGTPTGWTGAESGCYGLMQVVPACGGTPNGVGLLPNGHPNLTTSTSSAGWAGSIFYPSNNIEIGISGVADNRAQVEKKFPGCSIEQYTLMAVGDYNNYGSTKSCTVYNTAYDNPMLMAYTQYSTAAGYAAHAYP